MTRAAALAPDVAGFHYNLGLLLARLGRWPDAIAAYRQALRVQAVYPDAQFALAAAHHQAGQEEQSIAALRHGLGQRPQFVEGWSSLAVALADRGDLAGGIAALRRVVALRPEDNLSWSNLGVLLRRSGQYEQAIEACCRALSFDPNLTGALTSLGLAQLELRKFDEAVAALEQVVRLQPNEPDALNNLGYALMLRGSVERAIELYRQLTDLRPQDAGAWSNFGNALREVGQIDEAIIACRKAVALKPDAGDGWCNLGSALQEADQPSEALSALEKARAMLPKSPQVLINLSNTLADVGRPEEGVAALRRALEIDPNNALAHWLLAMRLLRLGEYGEGLREYEWRFTAAQAQTRLRHTHRPRWDGSELGGARILIHPEQGFGDAIQFARFIPLVAQRGGRVIIECPRTLRRILSTVEGLETVVTSRDVIPDFAVQCPMLSLPLALKMTAATIPADVPYLRADAAAVAQWRQRLGELPQRLKVGIAWAGNPMLKNDRHRSIAPSLLAPLAEVPGVRLISLQMTAMSGVAANAPTVAAEIGMTDWTAELADFADTAALVANLDLIICVDTAVAHLAGAMARPVWSLIPANNDWRWLIGREDSPWYPTMRIFRQKKLGDWTTPVDQIARALADRAAERSS
jgi:tetratricopeptide (TPR) repeat protein